MLSATSYDRTSQANGRLKDELGEIDRSGLKRPHPAAGNDRNANATYVRGSLPPLVP